MGNLIKLKLIILKYLFVYLSDITTGVYWVNSTLF